MFVITPPGGLKLLAACNMSCNTLWVLLAHDSNEQLVGRDINQVCTHTKYSARGTALSFMARAGGAAAGGEADIPSAAVCSADGARGIPASAPAPGEAEPRAGWRAERAAGTGTGSEESCGHFCSLVSIGRPIKQE